MDPIWSEADIALLRDAIRKLATGQRVVSCSFAGPPARNESYQIADLKELRSLLAEVTRSVAATSGAATYRLAASRKGFGS